MLMKTQLVLPHHMLYYFFALVSSCLWARRLKCVLLPMHSPLLWSRGGFFFFFLHIFCLPISTRMRGRRRPSCLPFRYLFYKSYQRLVLSSHGTFGAFTDWTSGLPLYSTRQKEMEKYAKYISQTLTLPSGEARV